MGIWLSQAETPEQLAQVGRQTAGQPCGVFYTDNLSEDYSKLCAAGVTFVTEPKQEQDAIYAHLHDLYGNEFVLVELRQS